MVDEMKKLKELFETIKDNDYNKSKRNYKNAIGTTLEMLLGKKEDNLPSPDYNGIEIKTKLGYNKIGITLFTLTPKSYIKDYAIKYLYDNYSYYCGINKSFKCNVFCNNSGIVGNKYFIKSKIDYEQRKIIINITDLNFKIIDKTIYWDFDDVEKRLNEKLTYLALIKGYPYKKENKIYYKYTNIDFYKLKSFDIFLKLLEKNLIYLTFNISTFKSGERIGQIHDRGTAFKIKNIAIDELFEKIDIN